VAEQKEATVSTLWISRRRKSRIRGSEKEIISIYSEPGGLSKPAKRRRQILETRPPTKNTLGNGRLRTAAPAGRSEAGKGRPYRTMFWSADRGYGKELTV